MAPSVAKISVEKFNSKEQILYDFDKGLGLSENVKTICKKTGLPESHVYGLKFLPTKDNPLATHYISEKNFETIKHSDCLKVVFSVKYLAQRIVAKIRDDMMRPICFEDLSKLCLDPIFIDEIADAGQYKDLIDVYINCILTPSEQMSLLITIVHLFQKGYIQDVSEDILQKTFNILKSSDTSSGEVRYCLALLQKIMMSKNRIFDQWKQKIIREIPIGELMAYACNEKSSDLQYNAILLINTIIRCCKGEKKATLIKEMNQRRNRENIYKHIILKGDLDKTMEHELYVLQTYILSLVAEPLRTEIDPGDGRLHGGEFELSTEDVRRITILMDFDEQNLQNQSVESLFLNGRGNSRISLASINTDESSRDSLRSSSIDCTSSKINVLTMEALRHYKKYHYGNFYQSQIEEKLYEPGIFVTSERVVRMLAKILHIGWDQPDSKSTLYQPVLFYCSSRTPYFLELFSRTMWLLSKTRREMKASTAADYPKVIKVLEKQLKIVLKTKPKDFKCLTDEMSRASFQVITDQIQQEKEDEFRRTLDGNPCVQELKGKSVRENEPYVQRHRINCLLTGAHFPKVLEKKTSGNIFVQLSKNQRDLVVYDITDVKSTDMKLSDKYKVEDITHVVVGKNCKHSALCNNQPDLAFSIVISHEEKIKFIAKDEKTACYWTDALNILAGHSDGIDTFSAYYVEELNQLVEMDIRLRLIDLQNISIPKTAPPVPKPPLEPRPNIAPKPKVRKHSRLM